MKKVICIILIATIVLVTLSFGMTDVQIPNNQSANPLTTQEMESIVGGGWCGGCVDLWIIVICGYIYDPTGLFCE